MKHHPTDQTQIEADELEKKIRKKPITDVRRFRKRFGTTKNLI